MAAAEIPRAIRHAMREMTQTPYQDPIRLLFGKSLALNNKMSAWRA
jgi:hypothetical protein